MKFLFDFSAARRHQVARELPVIFIMGPNTAGASPIVATRPI
jgi:hypothetical protein